MLWFIYIAMIAVGLFVKNSKAYDFSVILFMGLLAWLNTDAADYSAIYLATYLAPTSMYDMDTGWVFLNQVGSSLGLYYNGFACVVVILSLLLYREFGRRIGANTSFMLALFAIYPGLMSIVQFRQFVASCVGAMALAVICSNKRSKYIYFIILASCAFLIHRSAAVIFLVLLFPMLKAAGRRGRLFAIALVVMAGIYAVFNASSLGVMLFGEFRTGVYMGAADGTTAISRWGGIRNAILVAAIALSSYLCCRYMAREAMGSAKPSDYFSWPIPDAAKIIALLNIVLLALIPVVFITNDFMRFERFGLTYALGLFAMMQQVKNRHIVLSCKAFYVAICFVFAYFLVANTFDSVYGALLSFEYVPPFFS